MGTGLFRKAPQLDPERRAWSEYLAWTQGSCAEEYEFTEERAWERLQLALLSARVAPTGSDGGSTQREELQGGEGEIAFVPEDGFPGFFSPCD